MASKKKRADSAMRKHYVAFMSPGTFVSEANTIEVSRWDVKAVQNRASEIKQRYGAQPYGFYFYTMQRKAGDWKPKVVRSSGMYYLPHCVVRTRAQVMADNKRDEKVLRSNIESNGYTHIVQTTEGWKWTQPFNPKKDVLLK